MGQTGPCPRPQAHGPPLPPQACRDFLELAETHSRKWQRALQYEQEQRTHLEETIEQLAEQHDSLERAFRSAPSHAAHPARSLSAGEQPGAAGLAGSPSQGCPASAHLAAAPSTPPAAPQAPQLALLPQPPYPHPHTFGRSLARCGLFPVPATN